MLLGCWNTTRVGLVSSMSAFDDAWSVLKALEEQQMFRGTMHPAIQGMLARRGRYPGGFGYHLEGGREYVYDDEDGHPVPVNFRAPDTSFGQRGERDRRFRGDIDPMQTRRGSLFVNRQYYPLPGADKGIISLGNEQGRPEVFKMAPMMGGQMPKEDNGVEEYSHKDLDPEALIDFLVETMKMPYRDAKALTMSHKTKELVEANHRKGRLAARNQSGEAPMQGGY